MLTAVLGTLAIILQQVRSLPQTGRILRRGDTNGVSALTWSLALTNCIAWFIYGVVFDEKVFIINNIMNTIGALTVLLALARHGAASYFRPLLVGATAIAVSLGVYFVGGDTTFWLFAAGSGVVMFIPQAVKVFRSPVSGVSPLSWGLIATSSATWFAYGVATMQPAVLVAHSVILPCCIVVLARLGYDNTSRRRTSTVEAIS